MNEGGGDREREEDVKEEEGEEEQEEVEEGQCGRRERRLDSVASIDCGSPWLPCMCCGAREP